MSRREARSKQQETDSGGCKPLNAEAARLPRLDSPRCLSSAGVPGLLQRFWQAGNQAFSRLLRGQSSGGQPLPSRTGAEFQRAFNSDFSDVRVHADSPAQAAAQSLGAIAFAHGDDIYVGAQSPASDSPAGRALLAHELAHVVQQRKAGEVSPEMNAPGDRFEQAADCAAEQALQGQPAESATAGAPPAIQRQRAGNRATREEAQTALENFLRRAMRQQNGRALRVTPEVRDAITSLFIGDVGRLMGIEAWLNSPALPGDPEEFARQVARRLPATIERTTLERLNRMSGQAPPNPSIIGRAQEVVERTAPGSPEREEEKEAEARMRGEVEDRATPIPRRTMGPPHEPTPEERAEQVAHLERRMRGEEEPTTVGFASVDVLHLARIWGARQEILRGPRPPRTAAPEARSYPEVERVIQQVTSDALVPSEARGSAAANSFADSREVARDLARRLDIAQQQGQESIEVRLGDNYNRARDRRAIISEIERIIQLVRDALPHHAANVAYVDVFFGERWATRGMARGNR